MPPKRGRRFPLPPKGLAPGEKLKRNKLPGNVTSEWGWVDTEASIPSDITDEHRLATCGLHRRNKRTFCSNKYALPSSCRESPTDGTQAALSEGELLEDVIVISDDEGSPCSKKLCKTNPYCLNYLRQDQWEDKGIIGRDFQTKSPTERPVLSIRHR
jgi:hypothetical protein